jgi:Ca2+-binding RTX toxin-like protein
MRTFRAVLVAAVTAAQLFVLAGQADASSASVSKWGSTLVYGAGAGQVNDVIVQSGTTAVTFTDKGVDTVTPAGGSGCVSLAANVVRCSLSGITAAAITTQDLDDTVQTIGPLPANIVGGAGDDHLWSGTASDHLEGQDGADTFITGPGADLVDGGAGTDTVTYIHRTAPVSVSLDDAANDGESGEHDNIRSDVENVIGGTGNDQILGSAAKNILDGDDGNDIIEGVGGWGTDTLHGGSGKDVLWGGGSMDSLDGGPGADFIAGGGGTDVVHYDYAPSAVVVSLDDAANDGPSGEGDNVTADVENVIGSAYNDFLFGSSSANVLEGRGGSDVIDGRGGNDTLKGGPEGDSLRGDAGDDTLDGEAGGDFLYGGPGTDLVTYAARSASVAASIDGAMNDGEAGEADSIASDVENLRGGNGADTLTGSAAANVLDGGPRNDVLNGAGGDDTLVGGPGPLGSWFVTPDDDVLNGGAGSDTASYAARTVAVNVRLDDAANDGKDGEHDNVRADVENVTGGDASDWLYGDALANVLRGGPGNDTLYGNAGFDALDGGAGTDACNTGADGGTRTACEH